MSGDDLVVGVDLAAGPDRSVTALVTVDVLGRRVVVSPAVACENTPAAVCDAFGATTCGECPAYAAWRATLPRWGTRT